MLKASEDKTFPGASVASLASPWGQAVSAGDPNNTYFGSYREVFARDLYETFTGLQAIGDLETAEQTVRFLFERQQLPNGSMPRNSLINGKVAPDSFGVQLDETAYPILMALQAGITDAAPSIPRTSSRRRTSWCLRGPAFGVERWEEQDGFSPSTIASEIAGLVAAAVIAAQNGDQQRARLYAATADAFQRQVKGWTVTQTGLLSDQPYFIRLSKTGDPNAAISYNLGNGGPTLDQRAVVDAGFLELTRLGILRPRRRGHRAFARHRRREHQADHRQRGGLVPLQRRRVRRPACSTGGHGRRPGKATATSGRPWPVSAASMRSRCPSRLPRAASLTRR